MVTKRLYLQIGAQKKTRFFSLMYFCESLCINRIWHNYVIPQFLFCIIMSFRTSFHIPFRKLIPPFTLTDFFQLFAVFIEIGKCRLFSGFLSLASFLIDSRREKVRNSDQNHSCRVHSYRWNDSDFGFAPFLDSC